MRQFLWRQTIVFGATGALLTGAAFGMFAGACTSSSGAADAAGNGSVQVGHCANPTLPVAFGPDAYSAYIPDSIHRFSIPLGVRGLAATADVKWFASDPSKVQFQSGATAVNFGRDTPIPALLVTTQAAGDVDIIAQYGGECGSTTLHITAATDADWTIGDQRYNNGTILVRTGSFDLARAVDQDGGINAKCTNCHGTTATNSTYATVEHTPQQTGGFSDSELVGIFTMALVPAGAYFDESIVALAAWTEFHQWNMTPDQEKGMVVYLRSLTPAPQSGRPNFPGLDAATSQGPSDAGGGS